MPTLAEKEAVKKPFSIHSFIFGPIISRRLGRSLGVNILPIENKICNFDCIYCECGWNNNLTSHKFPQKEEISLHLEAKLKKMKAANNKFDTITFSGNGEPTLHPNFEEIIDDTIKIRDKYFPKIKISVLSNATNLNNEKVVAALKKVENPILKLDSANIETLLKINQPVQKNFKIDKILAGMQFFAGNFIMQTMFLRGENIDNTTKSEINELISIIEKTQPRQIMIYAIDRATPAQNLVKISEKELHKLSQILQKTNIEVITAI